MNPEKLARDIFPLTTMIRYNNVPHIIDESVAAHSYQVSVLCLSLYDEYKNKIKDLNLEKMLLMAIMHDIPEVFTGDIPYIVKTEKEELKLILDKIEVEKMEEIMPEKYFKLFVEYQKKDCPEAILVKLADTISSKIYADEEIKAGNTNLVRVLMNTAHDITKYKLILKQWIKK